MPELENALPHVVLALLSRLLGRIVKFIQRDRAPVDLFSGLLIGGT